MTLFSLKSPTGIVCAVGLFSELSPPVEMTERFDTFVFRQDGKIKTAFGLFLPFSL